MTRSNHRHASGLMGSPALPMMRSEPRSCRWTGASPKRMSARIAVGEVKSCVTLWRSTMAQ